MLKKINPKFLSEIQSEWDAMCDNRQKVIDSGKDFSLLAVTAPCIIDELGENNVNRILDVVCGTGYLTALLSKHANQCVSIDISPNSIALAKSRYADSKTEFVVSSISDFRAPKKFDVCVANMVFSCDPNWIQSVQSIYELLAENGKLLIMLPHPCYWSKYWGFENATWFKCDEEIFIEHDFSLSLVKSLGTSTYIHRPLSLYVRKICEQNFSLEKMREPYPISELPDEYNYDYPRFLFMKFTKI